MNLFQKINKKNIIAILVICLVCLLVLTVYLLIKTTNIESFALTIGPNIKLLPSENLATAVASNYIMYGPSISNRGKGNGEVNVQYILPEKTNNVFTGKYGFIIYDNTYTPELGSFVKIVRNDGLQLYYPSTGEFTGFDSQTNPTFFNSDNYYNSGIPSSDSSASYKIKPRPSLIKITKSSDLPQKLQAKITDFGYPTLYQNLVNLQGSGKGPDDYIRYAGNDIQTLYTALYGDNSQYSTYEKVVDANGKPYANGLDMPPYSLSNPNGNRTIYLLTPYAVKLYNTINGTNCSADKLPIKTPCLEPSTTQAPTTTQIPSTTREPTTTQIPSTTQAPTTTQGPSTTREPTTTQVPSTTKEPIITKKFSCSSYMGNILQTPQQNIIDCNNDNNNNCYYLGGNCWNASASKDISNADITCFYTPKNPDSTVGPYLYDFGCNNNKDDINYYIIKSIQDNNKNIIYQSSNINNSPKSNIPYIYNGSLQNFNEISLKNKNIGTKITITDIGGKTKNVALTTNYITDNNSQTIIEPNNSLISQIQALGASVSSNLLTSS